MDWGTLVSSIVIMGAMIGIGVLLARRTPLTSENRQLMVTIIVNVALPCIILNGIMQTPLDETLLKQIFFIFFLSVLLNCIGIGMGWLAAKAAGASPQKAREMAIVSALGNTGFIGLPLCAVLFGPKGALLAAVFDAGVDFTLWTVGVILLQQKRSLSLGGLKELLNIPMLAIVAGLVIALAGVQPPETVKTFVASLAALTSPLAMIYIGLLLPGLLSRKKFLPLPIIGLPIVMKLFAFPLAVILALRYVPLPVELAQVVMVQVTMPTLTLGSIVFARYAADEQMGAMATVFSTLLSMITIPFVVMLGAKLLHI
ncbi:AEC family transporter [Brevibacillus marinus]|uniref:AEC family transporter n=1 Tax=Brevibacillus marinus TaxID=2496837 RepID=UPI000F81A346|nr:AEC family transporter [Brevibacillus marinus]